MRKTTTLKVEVELRDALKQVAKDECRTVVGLIRAMLKERSINYDGANYGV